ncbi:YpoC family protein [Bacillus sp. Hm123]|uniref:YpoC family protein n=1 Tax=Bacillus sp. Hm123 TaxID=3450745 RepID=UPI003F42CFEE
MIEIVVPDSLKHPLFFQEETVKLVTPSSLMNAPYFIYELQGKETPWENPSCGLKMVQEAYQSRQALIEICFKEEGAEVEPLMKAVIALFFMSLFWGNHEPVVLNGWKEKAALFNVKPLNVEDRLSFVLARPFSYQAYRQIDTLMTEQQKQFAKHSLLK